MNKKRINYKIITYSLLALLCLAFMVLYDWLWVVPAIVLMFLNQRELNKVD